MQEVNQGNCSIEVEQGRVVVNMEGRPASDRAVLSAGDLKDKPLAESAVVDGVLFYAAKHAKGEMERCVTSTISDRQAVAALVAGWIAEGFVVESLTAREIKRQIAAIEKAEKEAQAARAAASQPAVEPISPAEVLVEKAESAEGAQSGPA